MVPSPSGASRRVEMACSEFWACKACQAGFAVSIRHGTLALVGDVGFAPKWGIDIVYGDIERAIMGLERFVQKNGNDFATNNMR